MNKEIIKKYKKEFDHWLNGGELLYSHIDDKLLWKSIDEIDKNVYPIYRRNPFQISEYYIIIINDEYVEFRKALAEGKIVEVATDYNDVDGYIWKSMEDKEFHYFSIDELRIKPEEPKFKVGDWVRAPSGCIYQINETNIVQGTEHFTPWQPNPSEWCWFHNGTVESLYFYKFHSIISEGYIADIPKDIEHVMTAQIFKYCEPFTGNLPTVIKDN